MADKLVECYAGRHYPDRPVAFQWEGRRLEVVEVERQWRTTGVDRKSAVLYHYRVRTERGRFHLIFDCQEDTWQVEAE